jgi:hypothetical protein
MFVHDLAPGLAYEVAKHRSGDDRVVEGPQDGDELGDQVDR